MNNETTTTERDHKFDLWRAAENIKRDEKESVNARLSEVFGPVDARLDESSLFCKENEKITWTIYVRPPWNSPEAWFSETKASLQGDKFNMNISQADITNETLGRLENGRVALRQELSLFRRACEKLAVDPAWIDAMRKKDEEYAAEQKAKADKAANLDKRRAEYRYKTIDGVRHIVGPDFQVRCEEYRRWGYGRQWTADVPGHVDDRTKRPSPICGDTVTELLTRVRQFVIPE